MRDIYKTTIEYFADWSNVAIYFVSVTSLGIHVSHGFWSAFQSLGFNHPKYTPKIDCASKLFGGLIAVGFTGLALFCHFQGAH
jgi:succinate dehydrogenase / fumarate reductase cytochrome b subunit